MSNLQRSVPGTRHECALQGERRSKTSRGFTSGSPDTARKSRWRLKLRSSPLQSGWGGIRRLGTRTNEANVRRWPMPEYRYTIFYLVERDDDRIDILRVMDGRRVRNVKRVPR